MSRSTGDEGAAAQLRILLADEDETVLRTTGGLLERLGHTVLAHAVGIAEAGQMIAREDPDAAVVVVHEDDDHALDLIEEIGAYSAGPVIVLIDDHSAGFVTRAAQRGIDAFARTRFEDDVQGAIELAVRRRAETVSLSGQITALEDAMERRGVIERAKGILMERHGLGDREAFELLRERARSSNRRVADLARAVGDGHALLPPSRSDQPARQADQPAPGAD